MTQHEFLQLLIRLSEQTPIGVSEEVSMYSGDEPILDEDGIQVINDVVNVGDGRFFIDRDDNDPLAVQLMIDLMANLEDKLPDLITAYRQHIEANGEIPF